MCTVTIVPTGPRGLCMRCNRDERRTRPAAGPPTSRRIGGRRALMPTDPASGGTWIAATDAPLIVTLLNVNLDAPPVASPRWRSRGTLIPALCEQPAADAALRAALAVEPADHAPFRLILADRDAVHEVASDGVRLIHRRHGRPAEGPRMFTSSGLGDPRVQAVRRELFEAMVVAAADPLAGQTAFHEHTWPNRPELSVCMARTDARSVSRTTVDLSDEAVTMAYQPLPTGPSSRASLPLGTGAAG